MKRAFEFKEIITLKIRERGGGLNYLWLHGAEHTVELGDEGEKGKPGGLQARRKC